MEKKDAIGNINQLMINKNIKQRELCDLLQISQPQLSKLLSLKIDRFFSAEQLCILADYFDVSIDYLTGRVSDTELDSTAKKHLCKCLVDLIIKGKASYIKSSVKEHVYMECDPAENSGLPFKHEEIANPYTMFYFSRYVDPHELMDGDDEMYLLTHGNDNEYGAEINEFLDKFFKYYALLKDGVMEEDIFKQVINGLIDKM